MSSLDELLQVLAPTLRAQLPVFAATLLCGIIIAIYTRTRASSTPISATASGTVSNASNGKTELKYTFEQSAIEDINSRLASRKVKVAKLFVHPIKSCRGISVQEARFTRSGLEYDRRWCILDASHRIITARAVPKMVLITPKIVEDAANPENSRLEVHFPADSGCEPFSIPLNPSPERLASWERIEDLSVHATTGIDGYITRSIDQTLPATLVSDTLSKYFNKPVHLALKGSRLRPAMPTLTNPTLDVGVDYHDGYPLLVSSIESFAAVHTMVKQWVAEQPEGKLSKDVPDHLKSLKIERYRPNIVFEGSGAPFAEDMWRNIVIYNEGESKKTPFALVSKCGRCMLPNVSPDSGGRNMTIPSKPLMQFRTGLNPANVGDSCFGCNAVPAQDGLIRVGDVVDVTEWADV